MQVAAKYETDSEQFGEDEYWLHPIETLYHCKGDCEDTSILASAIFSVLSEKDGPKDYVLGACVLLMPQHAMVGINVNGGVAPTSEFTPCLVNFDATDYYFGETTIDDPTYYWMGVGEIGEDFLGASVTGFAGYSTEYVR